MAVYTDITDDELAQLLADFDLGAAVAFKGIAEGVENSNFLLETDKGRFILTVYEKRVREEELPFFLDLMRWLAEHGYPCATPMSDRSGQALKRVRGKPCAIVSFLPGLSVRRPSVAHCREAGDINYGPRDQREAQPKTVGNGASRRLRQTPDDILDGDGQREIRRGERQITRHRRQKQPDTLPQTHADAQQHGSAD